jgi:hypothetical protein
MLHEANRSWRVQEWRCDLHNPNGRVSATVDAKGVVARPPIDQPASTATAKHWMICASSLVYCAATMLVAVKLEVRSRSQISTSIILGRGLINAQP